MADDGGTAKKSAAQVGDHVTFNSQALAGDKGLVVERPGTPEGKLAVLCVGGAVVHADRDDLTIVDRAIFPGQMVAWASDPGGMAGVVTAVDAVVDLADSDSAGSDNAVVVASGVPQSRLRGVTELIEGDFVTSGPWLGRVLDISVDVDVRFDDGAVCRVFSVRKRHGSGGLRPDPYCESVFYPGQHVDVCAADASVFQAAQWLNGQWQSTHAERGGTVARVELTDALVFWVGSARLGGGDKRLKLVQASAPPPRQRARDLAFFYPDNLWFWGIGDRCFLRDADGDATPMSVVVDSRTTVDVLWQDGTRRHGVPSTSLVDFDSHGELFFPGHRVVSLDAIEDAPAAAVPRVGIVRDVNWKDQTVRVSWLSSTLPGGEEEEPTVVDETTTVVSAYDLAMDYDQDVFYGDVVVRVVGDGSSDAGTDKAAADADGAGAADLSWVGHVIDVSDSHVLVKWGDGNTSKVLPHEVELVNPCSILNALDEARDEDMPQEEEGEGEEEEEEEEGGGGGGGGGEVNGDGSTEKKKAAGDNVASGGDGSFHLRQFDVVTQCPPDHHFVLLDKEQDTGDVKKWTKRVHKEWEILQNNLPDTIYVRAFEERMDLLRAAMVGAAGTPYHDGLFFFDMELPPSYPAVPPLVHYNSFGLRLNPNLGDTGGVCLSLLDAAGSGCKGCEHWSPTSSSVLQVVVSLQGLVLTAEPYYNEHDYAFQRGTPQGARNALPYAETAYVLTLRTMLRLLRRPPAGYEALVADHFRCRGRFVLRACEAYLQGRPVGTFDAEAGATEGEGGRQPCSAGLRLALNGILPRLVEAFAEIGADGCEQFGRLWLPHPGGGAVAPPCI